MKESFSKIDNDLRYSSAPRAVLETALIKASMPSIDYDLDAILSSPTFGQDDMIQFSLFGDDKRIQDDVFVNEDIDDDSLPF